MSNNPFWTVCDACGNNYAVDHADKHKEICQGAVN